MPAFAGFIVILLYSVYRAVTDRQPSYVLGGLMVAVVAFILLAYVSKKIIGFLQRL